MLITDPQSMLVIHLYGSRERVSVFVVKVWLGDMSLVISMVLSSNLLLMSLRIVSEELHVKWFSVSVCLHMVLEVRLY
jgi:hypothetical protein